MSKEIIDESQPAAFFAGSGVSDDSVEDNRLEQLEQIVQSSDSIVHDMNNQLTTIMAMSDLLIRSSKNLPSVSDGLQRILESARELSGLASRWQDLLHEGASDRLDSVGSEHRNSRSVVHETMMASMTTTRPGHILLIDDDEVVSAATEQMLLRLKYEVTSCATGMEGIDYYRDNHARIGLVVLDMMMPEMDGGQVYAELVKINPDVDVLVSSGYSHNEAAQELLKNGVRGYLQKPFRIKELSTVVSALLPLPDSITKKS